MNGTNQPLACIKVSVGFSFYEASGTYIKSFCFKSIEAAKSTVQNESHSLLTNPKENGISLVALSSTRLYFDFVLFSAYNFLCQ